MSWDYSLMFKGKHQNKFTKKKRKKKGKKKK